MFYLFKTPPVNSASSLYELVAESHDRALIEAVYQAYQGVGHYDCLFVATVPLPQPKGRKGTKVGTHFAKPRPDDPKKF